MAINYYSNITRLLSNTQYISLLFKRALVAEVGLRIGKTPSILYLLTYIPQIYAKRNSHRLIYLILKWLLVLTHFIQINMFFWSIQLQQPRDISKFLNVVRFFELYLVPVCSSNVWSALRIQMSTLLNFFLSCHPVSNCICFYK